MKIELAVRLATDMMAMWVAGVGAMAAAVFYWFNDPKMGTLCVGVMLIGAAILTLV